VNHHVPFGPLAAGILAAVVAVWAVAMLTLGQYLTRRRPRRRAHGPAQRPERPRLTRDDFTLVA
jgi:hypothetical protein